MEIVISVAAKVAEYLVAPIIHPFTYCCTYKTNFEKLNNEVDKLKNARESVQYDVDDSRIEGDGIQHHVEEWLIAANKEINEVETLIEDKEKSNNRCLKGLWPNLRTRYQLSKKAVREANALVRLREKGSFLLRSAQFASSIAHNFGLESQHKAKSASLAQFRKVLGNSSTLSL
ncbi:hypothetical protein AB3S75_015049 [Citrus x aurantiifolia]